MAKLTYSERVEMSARVREQQMELERLRFEKAREQLAAVEAIRDGYDELTDREAIKVLAKAVADLMEKV